MVKRIQIQPLILFALLLSLPMLSGAVFGNDLPKGILVDYSFDDQNVETGPDTFAVYKKSKGTVGLSSAFPYNGYHSVEIKDVAGDKDFPELQGYFPLQKTGSLFAHFAFLVIDPYEPLNIALAGPKWFQLKKDGICFWLLTKNGYLYHYSDSMPKKLFAVNAFTWYTVDLNYAIEQGQYNLSIKQEGQEEALVELKQQSNSSGNPNSSVDKFSFIGDLADKSNVVYYLDDIVIGTNKEIIKLPFRAPGRHKLFFDYIQEYQKKIHIHAICLPVSHMTDIGLNEFKESLVAPEGAFMALMELLAGKNVAIQAFENQHPETFSLLSAVKEWQQGCAELVKLAPKKASNHFLKALMHFDAPIYQLSYAMALAESGQYNKAINLLGIQYSYWADDPRYAIAQAMIALNSKDWQAANGALEPFAISVINKVDRPTLSQLWEGKLNGDLLASFREKQSAMWEEAIAEFIVAEQYFYLLLWSNRHHEALEYAQAMTQYLAKHHLPTTLWQTRIGDSYFISQDYTAALSQYQQVLNVSIYKTSLLKKMSDIAFVLGDIQKEKHYREQVYGTLHP